MIGKLWKADTETKYFSSWEEKAQSFRENHSLPSTLNNAHDNDAEWSMEGRIRLRMSCLGRLGAPIWTLTCFEFWSLNEHTSVICRPGQLFPSREKAGSVCLCLYVGMGWRRVTEFYDMQNKWPHTRLIVTPTPRALKAANNRSPFQDFEVAHPTFWAFIFTPLHASYDP